MIYINGLPFCYYELIRINKHFTHIVFFKKEFGYTNEIPIKEDSDFKYVNIRRILERGEWAIRRI